MNSMNKDPKICEDLAYLCGVIAGDGCLFYRPKKHEYGLAIVGDPSSEKDYYQNVIAPLFKRLFDITVIPKYFDKNTTYGIRIWSKDLFKYLTEIIKLPHGRKAALIKIPKIFKTSDLLTKEFIKGIVDTDFSIALKKRYRKIKYYPVITGASKSSTILKEIAEYLSKEGFTFSLELDKIRTDPRFKKPTIISMIYIYSHKHLLKWINQIGFRNPRHLRKIELWKQRNGR